MQSAIILDMLRSAASTGKAPSGSDALAHLVHWLAAHAERLAEEDVQSLLTVGLSLYNTELEKSWNIDFESVVYASSLSTLAKTTAQDKPAAAGARGAETSDPDQARARAEAAIAALVEMRRPGSPGALSAAKHGRRWTDSPQWALTYRG